MATVETSSVQEKSSMKNQGLLVSEESHIVEHGNANSLDIETSEQKQSTILKPWRLGVITLSLCLGTFLVALDINIIGVAVPKITSVFQSLEDASWYATAYLLPVTALQPTMGYLYKSFAVRTVYFASIAIFEAGSTLCAAAPSSTAFILGRALSGVGAAGLLQGALTIITLTVELEKRPLFQGIVISVYGLSVCVGPVLGGAFVDYASWRWCFWINLPVGAFATVMLAVFLRLRNTQSEQQKGSTWKEKLLRMDYFGTTTFLGALVCMILALQWGGYSRPWSSPTIIGLLTGFGVLTVVFVWSQWWNQDRALIPAHVLGQRSVFVGSLYLLLVGMFNYTYTFYLPFYFQAVQSVSATESGLRIIPFMLAMIVFVGITGFIVTRWGYYVPYMILGTIICCVGAGLVTGFEIDTPVSEWATSLVIAGAGVGTAMQMPYTAVQIVLSEDDIPTGNALLVFFNQLGGIIALPIAQAIWLASLRSQLKTLAPDINADAVIAVGATGLGSVAKSSTSTFHALRQAYTNSLTNAFYLGLAAICVATFCTPAMEFLNIKREAEKRKAKESSHLASTM